MYGDITKKNNFSNLKGKTRLSAKYKIVKTQNRREADNYPFNSNTITKVSYAGWKIFRIVSEHIPLYYIMFYTLHVFVI
jgi:hypothetical protein